jgi:transcriptional activator protein UGA3
MSCRRRKKKCDEQQPTCGDCTRLGLQCVPRTRTALQPGIAISEIGSQSRVPTYAEAELGDTSEDWAAPPPLAVADTHNAADHLSDGGGSPPVSPFGDWIALIDDEDETGTALCRPENLAGSVALVDLPVPCPHEDEMGYATFLPPTALNNLTGVTLGALRTWSIGERHLLNHFLQSVSRALVVAVKDEDNSFLRVVVPMALESDMVRHALVALSACHLSRVYPAFEDTVFVHRSVALQALKVALSNDEEDDGEVEWTLATTLLLCLTEVCLHCRPMIQNMSVCANSGFFIFRYVKAHLESGSFICTGPGPFL